jgi:glycosyltransferase involved in cell wall biosynthesis
VRLVFVTQRIDPGDPVLGATVAKLEALAARVDEVAVLADHAVEGALPANCVVHPFAAGRRATRGLRFEQALARELARRPRPAAVVAHMCPIYAVLAAPLARPLGTRVLLWYAHWNRTRVLEAAVRASNLVISVDARSVPIASSKVVGIGHGIEVADFSCTGPPAGALDLVALGRYSAAKGLETIVRGVASASAAGLDVRLALHGTSSHPDEAAERARLEALVASLGAGHVVDLGGPLPRTEIPGLLARSAALVNNMRPGAPDKVVYEACAACRPVLVSNPLFDELVDDLTPQLRFPLDDDRALAERIAALVAAGPEARASLGTTLRERVLARHSVDSWADAVVALAGGAPPSTLR